MRRLWLVAAIALFALAGCSSEGSETDAASASQQASEEAPFELDATPVETTEALAIKSYKFDPEVIQVTTGSEITWTNEDDFPHNVHFLTGSDETHDLPIGESVAVAFDEVGDFYYECSIHPQQMRGKVIVTG